MSFFACSAENFYFFMIKLVLLHGFTSSTCCGVADRKSAYGDHRLWWRRSCVRTPLKLSRFLWLGEKISLKYLLIGGGTFVPPCLNGGDLAHAQTGYLVHSFLHHIILHVLYEKPEIIQNNKPGSE